MNTEFYNACRIGTVPTNIDLVVANTPNTYGDTPISVAAYYGRIDVVRALIDAGVVIVDSAIIGAARNGHVDVVKMMAGAGSSADALNKALVQACANDHVDVIKLLIELGADVNDDDGAASLVASDEVLRLLIDAKINPTYAIEQDSDEITALLIASGCVLEKNGLVSAVNGGHILTVRAAAAAGADLNIPGLLNKAVASSHLNIVKELLDAKVGVETTALEYARTAEVASLLIEYGISVVNTPALVNACHNKHWKLVRALIDGRVDVNYSVDGRTAIERAAYAQHLETVQLLILAGADVQDAFITTCTSGNKNIMTVLIDNKVNINGTTNNGTTGLSMASKALSTHVVRQLLAAKADVNLENSFGATAYTSALLADDVRHKQTIISLLEDAGMVVNMELEMEKIRYIGDAIF